MRTRESSDTAAAALAKDAASSPVRRKGADLTAFFERLRQAMEARRMSQAELARELGVGVATVSEWFTRGRVPNGDVILRLPGVLMVNGHWLLTGYGPREVQGDGQSDLYRRGAEDALQEVHESLERLLRRFGSDLP